MDSTRRSALLGALASVPLIAAGCTAAKDDNQTTTTSNKGRRRSTTLETTINKQSPPAKTPNVSTKIAKDLDIGRVVKEDEAALKDSLKAVSSLAAILPNADIYKALRFIPVQIDSAFRWQHADILLANADFLLSRCLEARSEWQDRYLKFHTFLFELEQFEILDKIHNVETEAGFYDIDSAIADADLSSTSSLIRNLMTTAMHLDTAKERMDSENWNQRLAQTIIGWLSHISAYATEGAPDRHAIFNGIDKTVLEHCKDESFNIATFNLQNEIDRLSAERSARKGDLEALQARVQALQKKSNWESRNSQFRMQRTAALKKLFEKKRVLLSDPEGGLNFRSQLNSALSRCERDYSDGMAHAVASERGLQIIFGYNEKLPNSVQSVVAGHETKKAIGQSLDEAIEWTRNASSWLTVFSQRDGMQAPCFSLRRLVSKANWEHLKKSGSMNFVIPEDMFPGQSHVRLRGTSLHTVGGRGIFGASLNVPSSSLYRMRNGGIRKVDQGDIPVLRVGAVRDYESNRAPSLS